MKTKFAMPTNRDLRFERTQPDAFKRAQFVMDDAVFSASIADGFAIVICLIGFVALLGILK